ncbi:Fur family transcriptional regulator [Terrabacter carboxydivorans]|uniref:Fur family transcriptional regulator n=1 Tax=Terrabacter carboxydivorans TaxID=619730 RepID=A0ABP5YK60_9MICO
MSTSPQSASSPSADDSVRVAEAVSRLRSAGERVTPARYAVLRVVDAADLADEHLTAEQIGARVAHVEPSVHRATVYRTLTSLVATGVLSHVHLGGSSTVYHLTEPAPSHDPSHGPEDALATREVRAGHDGHRARPAHHAHVQCHVCGRVLDVAPGLFDDVAARLHEDLGFVLDTGHAGLLGTCRDCARGGIAHT